MLPSQSGAELWDAFVHALLAERPDAECDFGARHDKVADDGVLLGRLLADGAEGSVLRLWDNAPHIVISKRLAGLPGAGDAATWAGARGYPVAVRASGGTAVVHRPGVLNISLLRISPRPLRPSQGFDELCDMIGLAGARLGFAFETGKLAQCYCAGSHDIGWRGRKIAGTAAVLRSNRAFHGGLFHASLVVFGDWRRDLELLCGYERLAGLPANYDIGAHTSLMDVQRKEAPASYSAAARSCLGEQPNFSL